MSGVVGNGVYAHWASMCGCSAPDAATRALAPVELRPREGEEVAGVSTIGRHPALLVYDPRPLWHALRERWDVIDIHEEPFALVTAEVLLLRALRRNRRTRGAVHRAESAKQYPMPFRWFERRALRTAAGISACNDDAARIARRRGSPVGLESSHSESTCRIHALTSRRELRPRRPRRLPRRIAVGFLGRLVPEKGLASC